MELQKKGVKPIVKIVNFFNWTAEDFSHPYGGDMQFFPAGAVTPIHVGDNATNEGVRDLMAYHLAIRECNKIEYVPPSKEDRTLKDLIAKALSTPVNEVIPPKRAQAELASAPKEETKETVDDGAGFAQE